MTSESNTIWPLSFEEIANLKKVQRAPADRIKSDEESTLILETNSASISHL